MADNRFKASDVIGADGSEALFEVYGYRTAAAIGGIVGNISRGTASAKTIVASGDAFRITATGYDGAAQQNAAEISMQVGGTPGANDMPGSIVFKVTPDGSVTLATALTIAQSTAITAAGTFTATGGIISTAIGASSPSTGAFTTLGATSTVTITGAATFTNSGTPITMTRTTAATNTYVSVGINRLTSSANMADGFGVGYNFQYADDTSGTLAAGGIGFVRDGADNQTKCVLQTMVAGTQTTEFTVSSTACAITPDTTITGDLAVNGGDITTSQTTGNVFNATVTTGNLFGAGTTIQIGALTGTATIRNATTAITGDLKINTAGSGLYIKEGANATMGTVTLAGGTATATTTKASATMRVILSHQAGGGTSGELTLGTITAGTSFVINSSDGADTGTVLWIIVEPA